MAVTSGNRHKVTYFGANRMIGLQPRGMRPGSNLSLNRPSYGLGPKGMPGSAGYAGDKDWRERPDPLTGKRKEGTENAYERMGLYWTGSSITQGRPIREIDQRMELAEQGVGLQERGLDIKEKGVGIREKGVGLQERGLDLRKRSQEAAQAASGQRMGIDRVEALSSLRDDDSRRSAAGLMGIDDPEAVAGIRAPMPSAKAEDPLPPYADDAVLQTVRRAITEYSSQKDLSGAKAVSLLQQEGIPVPTRKKGWLGSEPDPEEAKRIVRDLVRTYGGAVRADTSNRSPSRTRAETTAPRGQAPGRQITGASPEEERARQLAKIWQEQYKRRGKTVPPMEVLMEKARQHVRPR